MQALVKVQGKLDQVFSKVISDYNAPKPPKPPSILKNVHTKEAIQALGVIGPLNGKVNSNSLPGDTPALILEGLHPKAERNVIAVHRVGLGDFTVPDKGTNVTVPGLMEVFLNLPSITFMAQALQTNYVRVQEHVERLKRQVNPPYREFLDAWLAWANPGNQNKGRVVRHLWMWGPAYGMLPKGPTVKGAALGGDFINKNVYGPSIQASLWGLPSDNLVPLITDSDSGAINNNHLTWACPRGVIKKPHHLEIGSMAVAYWNGALTEANVGAILPEGCDILMRAQVVNEKIYQTTILRYRAPVSEIKIFDEKTELLQSLGKWDRVLGSNLIDAFRHFIPGSAPLPDSWAHFSLEYEEVFKKLTQSIGPASDVNGISILGRTKVGNSYSVNWESRPSITVTGTSKIGGKTTLSTAIALSTKPMFFIPLTPEEHGGHLRWGEEFWQKKPIAWGSELAETPVPAGQRLISLNLVDALYLVESEPAPAGQSKEIDHAKVLKLQEELHEKDRLYAIRIAKHIYKTWKIYGSSVGLPISFKIESGTSIRLFNFYASFLDALREEQRIWYKARNEKILVVVDNFSTLIDATGNKGDHYLGDLRARIAENLATTIGSFASHGANIGILTLVITHTPGDFKIAGDLYEHFGMDLRLGEELDEVEEELRVEDDHQTAKIIIPSTKKVAVKDLSIELPPDVLKWVQQMEPDYLTPEGEQVDKILG